MILMHPTSVEKFEPSHCNDSFEIETKTNKLIKKYKPVS